MLKRRSLSPKSIEITQEEPCFIIDEDNKYNSLYVHVHRKDVRLYEDCMKITLPYADLYENQCGDKEIELNTECTPFDEWYETSGPRKVVTLSERFFLHASGLWQIDIYDVTTVMEIGKSVVDPTNLYRRIHCSPDKKNLILVDTYEFNLGPLCDDIRLENVTCPDRL